MSYPSTPAPQAISQALLNQVMDNPLLAGFPKTNEPFVSISSCNDFILLGARRSIQALWKLYRQNDLSGTPNQFKSMAELENMAYHFDWFGRANLYDIQFEAQKHQKRINVLNTGLAVNFERVDSLKTLAEELFRVIMETDKDGNLVNIWRTEPRRMGSETEYIKLFNSSLIAEFRLVLDDIAKEVGGRRAFQTNVDVDLDKLSVAQIEALANGVDIVQVLLMPDAIAQAIDPHLYDYDADLIINGEFETVKK